MPNRIIKESICVSDSIDALSWFEEVLFYRLIVTVDDYGRFDGRVPVIKNRLFPLKEGITAKAVKDGIQKLARVGLVSLYTCNGKPYLSLPTWNDHQNVRAKKSKYPAPPEGMHASAGICNQMLSDVPVIQSESVSESESNAEATDTTVGSTPARGKRFVPPDVEEVRAYCAEKGYCLVDPERFVSYYTSNGWMVGRTKMKDWKSAAAGWQSREKERLRKEAKPAVGYTHGADRLAAMIGRGEFDD